MTSIRLLGIHRTWVDWAGIVLGVLIGLSPWFVGLQGNETVMLNAIFVGAVVLLLAELELVGLQRWQELGSMAFGLWLIVSPFVFGYAQTGELMYWHFGLGAAVVLLAALELWQDWTLSDSQLAQHGQ